MTLLDVRPGRLDVRFRPGNPVVLELAFPADTLAGRTFTASLGDDALDVDVTGDTITVTANAALTEDVTQYLGWALVETTGDDQELIVGRWSPSEHGTTSPDGTVTVVTEEATVTVSVIGAVGFVIDGGLAAGTGPDLIDGGGA